MACQAGGKLAILSKEDSPGARRTMSTPRCESRLSAVLQGGRIVLRFTAHDVEEGAESLLAPLLAAEGLSETAVGEALENVRKRERAAPTSIGPVSIPHARVPALSRIVAGIGLNARGIDAGRPDTQIVLAFASPSQATVEHLKFLSHVAKVLRNDDVVEELLEADTEEAVLSLLREREV